MEALILLPFIAIGLIALFVTLDDASRRDNGMPLLEWMTHNPDDD